MIEYKNLFISYNIYLDDKKLTAALKRLGVQNIPGIEEINLFKEDGDVIHFKNPKRNLIISL